MSFITPALFVAGVIGIAIPIAIHLLSRRRRTPVPWAAMRFLLEAFRRHRRRLQVEQLILLAVRCLIIALLGAALARPILEATGVLPSGGARLVYLVIDDGVASGVTSEDRTALERQLADAHAIVSTLGPADRVGVITASRPARGLLVPPSSDHAAVLELIDDLTPTGAPTDLGGAMTVLRGAIDELDNDDDSVHAYVLSEFRRGSAALDTPLPTALEDLGPRVTLMAAPPAEDAVGNIRITNVDPVRSVIVEGAQDGSGQVTVHLARDGAELGADVTRVRLEGEGLAAMPPRDVQWGPGESTATAEFVLDLAAGEREAAITAVIDHDPLLADNQRHVVLDLRRRVPAVLLDRRAFGHEPTLDRLPAGVWMRQALDPAGDGRIDVIDVEPTALSAADLRAVDTALLPRPDLVTDAGWGHLADFVARGGLLIVTPPGDLNIHQWSETFVEKLALPWQIGIETVEHAPAMPLAVEQPSSELMRLVSSELDRMARSVMTYRSLPIDADQTQADTVLTFEDGSPLLILGAPRGDDVSRGLVALLAVSPQLTWTNLPSQVLMVPLMQELVRQGLSLVRSEGTIGVGERPALALGAAAQELEAPSGAALLLDEAGRPGTALTEAGVYTVRDGAGVDVGALAVNIDPGAAALGTQSAAAVASWLEASGPWTTFDRDDLGAALRDSETGGALAGILLVIVLVLVLLETVLARWFSHAMRGGRAASGEGMRGSIGAAPVATLASTGGGT